MTKSNKFAELIYNEIGKNYAMEGKTFDQEIVSLQAQTIADELVKQFRFMSAQDLTILLPIVRKNEGRITFNMISKTFQGEEWAIALNEFKNEQKKAIALTDQSEKRIPDKLWQAIFWHEISKLCARYQQGEWANMYEYKKFIESNNIEKHIDAIYRDAQIKGMKPEDFKITISLGRV